jgi:hypothetical protein
LTANFFYHIGSPLKNQNRRSGGYAEPHHWRIREKELMIKQLSWRLPILAGVLAASAGSATAQTTNCSGALAPGSYTSVNVPAGQSCFVTASTLPVNVTGNVTVGTGATLVASPPAFPNPANFVVNGSLLSTGAATIEITAENILGNVSVSGTTLGAFVTDSFIGGTLSVSNSKVVGMVFSRNNVGGSMLVQNNQCFNEANCDAVGANVIGGSLVCSGNSPPPVDIGGPNTVGGSKVAQCSGL